MDVCEGGLEHAISWHAECKTEQPQQQHWKLSLWLLAAVVDTCHADAGASFRAAVQQLAKTLKRVEVFYNSLGGLMGYQHKCLEIMLERQQQQQGQADKANSSNTQSEVTFHMPQGPNLAGPNGRQLAAQSAAAGLEALPHMAEIYPLGGHFHTHFTLSCTCLRGHCLFLYSFVVQACTPQDI